MKRIAFAVFAEKFWRFTNTQRGLFAEILMSDTTALLTHILTQLGFTTQQSLKFTFTTYKPHRHSFILTLDEKKSSQMFAVYKSNVGGNFDNGKTYFDPCVCHSKLIRLFGEVPKKIYVKVTN